jgi:hypothetical protein
MRRTAPSLYLPTYLPYYTHSIDDCDVSKSLNSIFFRTLITFQCFRLGTIQFNSYSASPRSEEPPTGLGKLIQVVQKRYPSLTVKESIKAIFMIKEKNGGVLKGLKFIKFHKLLKMVVREKVQVDKQNYKEGRKLCPVCFRQFSKRQAVERHMVVQEEYESTVIEEELPQGDKDLPDFDETIEDYDELEQSNHQSSSAQCAEKNIDMKLHLTDTQRKFTQMAVRLFLVICVI